VRVYYDKAKGRRGYKGEGLLFRRISLRCLWSFKKGGKRADATTQRRENATFLNLKNKS